LPKERKWEENSIFSPKINSKTQHSKTINNMKNTIKLIVATLLLAMPVLSMAQKEVTVPYKTNTSYSVMGDHTILSKKFNSEKEFLRYFQPTFVNGSVKEQKIDFTKQFAIALVGDMTSSDVRYTIDSITAYNGELTVHYTIDKKDTQLSYRMKPQVIMVLDMEYARMPVNFEGRQVTIHIEESTPEGMVK